MSLNWIKAKDYTDIIYEKMDGIAKLQSTVPKREMHSDRKQHSNFMMHLQMRVKMQISA
jgi:hypothetical protein